MDTKKPTPRALFFILLAFIIIFGIKFVLFLALVLFVILPIVFGTGIFTKIKNVVANIKKDGVDISKFQNIKNSANPSQKPFSSFSPPLMENFRFKTRYFVILFLLLLGVFIVIDGLVNIPPGHVGVIYDRGRGVLEEEMAPGLHLKIPFWQQVNVFTTKKQVFTMAGDYDGVKDQDAVRGRSGDGQEVFVDISVTYRIAGKDASFIREEFLTEEEYRETIVRPAARSVVYDGISKFNALDLLAEKRAEFTKDIFDNLEGAYAENNIQLTEVFVRGVTFSSDFSRTVENKQIAAEKVKTAEFERQEAEIRKEKKIIEAEADAEAIRLKGQALAENPEIIQLEFINKMAPSIKWGILPDGVTPLMDVSTLQQ